MKKKMVLGVFVAVMIVGIGIVLADKPQDDNGDYKGNKAPSGPHYNLNLIATGEKMADIDSGKRIFIKMSGRTKILLSPGEFQVLDGNGTDGTASFQLPAPEPGAAAGEATGTPEYLVFVRVVGKPQAEDVEITTYYDEVGNGWVASEETLSLPKSNKFTNASRELLYVWVDGAKYPLFDTTFEGYLWDVDANGRRVIQMRFYENVEGWNVDD